MTRVKSFAAPHKGLRSLMSRFSYYLGFIDVDDPTQLSQLKELGQELFTLLTNHAHTENEHTLTLLEERVKGASEHDRHDHQQLEGVQLALEQQLAGLTGNESPDELHSFYLAFSRFQSQYLEHIFEEETVTELLLQDHFTDEELIQQRILVMRSFASPLLLLWLKNIIPAQRETESVGMLSGLKATIPPESFEQIMATLQEQMEPGRFEALRANLNAG